jgi:hypothetical protein
MYRNGEILGPSASAQPLRALPAPTGPIIDIYPGFDQPKPRSRARIAAPRRQISRTWLWLALLVVVAATAAIAFRGPIVEAIPVLGDAYTAVGLAAGDGHLQLQNVRVIGVYARDDLRLSIQGEIANPSGRQLEVPAVELTLRAVDGSILMTRTLPPARTVMDPGGALRFATEIVDPPAGAYDLTIRIGDGPVEVFDFI